MKDVCAWNSKSTKKDSWPPEIKGFNSLPRKNYQTTKRRKEGQH